MKQRAQYIRATDFAACNKDFDHEDVNIEFSADEALDSVFKTCAAFVVFFLLLAAIYVMTMLSYVGGV